MAFVASARRPRHFLTVGSSDAVRRAGECPSRLWISPLGPAAGTMGSMDTLGEEARVLEERFLATVAQGLPGEQVWAAPLVIGVSGGADSVGLLLSLDRLARSRPAGAKLIVAHARHDLRPEAADDEAFVAALAGRLGHPFTSQRLPVLAGDGTRGEGVEGRARRMRYAWLGEVAGSAGARHVAVAHTADDQAETILHRLLRGTGVGGLSGMAAARELTEGVALVRPLLGCYGGDVRRFLTHVGQPWREDPSNSDVAYARNFLRHRVLREIAAGPYPAAAAALRRVGVQAGALAGALSSAAGHLLEVYGCRQPDGSVVLQTGPLARLDQHLLAEMFVTLWRREAWPQRDMTARHYTLLAEMVRTAEVPLLTGVSNRRPLPAAWNLPGGIEARTAPGRLSIGPVKRTDAARAGSA